MSRRYPSLVPSAGVAWPLGLMVTWSCLWAMTLPAGNFPLNDDWVYALAVRAILLTGRFSLPSPATADVIAQAYWGALFCLPAGFSFDALRVSTFVLGGGGLVAFFLLIRELGGSRTTAGFAALSLAANPLYLGLSASFMTDVPFTALSAASLWLHARGVRRGSTVSLAAALALALAAMLVRQFGLALFLAYGVGHLMRSRPSVQSWIVAALPVALATLLQLGYEHWLVASGRTAVLPIPLTVEVPQATLHIARRLALVAQQSLAYAGLFAAPFLIWLYGRPRARTLLACTMLTLGFLGIALATGDLLPKFGNVLLLSGIGPRSLRDTWVLGLNKPPVTTMAAVIWLLLSALAYAGTAVILLGIGRFAVGLLGGFRREARSQASLPASMLVIAGSTLAGTLLIATLSEPPRVFDRYVLPMIVPLCGFMFTQHRAGERPDHAGRRLGAGLFVAMFAIGSVLATHDYLAWNRARWQATDALLAAGISPRRIDGGYEFNGWLLNAVDYKEKPGKSFWWVYDDEYVVASGPLPGYAAEARVAFSRWLPVGPSAVLVLHRRP